MSNQGELGVASTQEYPAVPRNTQEYPGVPGSTQEYPGVPRSNQEEMLVRSSVESLPPPGSSWPPWFFLASQS